MVASEREELRAGREAVELSVVVPVYGCRDCLRALHERVRRSVEPLTDSWELVLVDDRSPDGAWDDIRQLAREDPAVRGFRLSRNFGQHPAITAGLAQSRGRWTVVMDCDLQEPPEAIPALYAKAHEGYDIVLTTRRRDSRFKLRTALGRLYLRLRNFFLQATVDLDVGTLSIVSRKVVDAFVALRDRDREYVLALNWLGYEHTTVEVERARRHQGRSAYTFDRLLRVAVDGMFFQTTLLLHWIVFAGFLIALGGVGLAVVDIVIYLTVDTLPGYTSLAVLLLVLSGIILTSMGVIGLYVGRVFEQVKERPLYVIDSVTPDASTDQAGGNREPSRASAAAR